MQEVASILFATNAILFSIGSRIAGYFANIEAATVANKLMAVRAEHTAIAG